MEAQEPSVAPDSSAFEEAGRKGGFFGYMSEHFHGSVEAGVLMGRPPFSLEAPDALNFIGRGTVQLDVLGIPLTTSFDLGTMVNTRGYTNAIQLGVDVDRLKQRIQLQDARHLEDALGRSDSLRDALSQQVRLGQADSLRAIAAEQQEIIGQAEHLTDTLPQAPAIDTLVQVPAIDTLAAQLPSNSLPKPPSVPPMPDSVPAIRTDPASIDSTRRDLTAAQNAEQRAKGMVNMDMSTSAAGRFLMGLRRAQVGLLAPSGSEFLLNGLSMQGIGVEWASERFFLSFDHGRCLDDTWRSATASSQRLRRIQESLFLLDASDLDPRKLTAVRAGVGTPEGTHVHIGLLRGRRSGLPYGVDSPPGDLPFEMTNHVLEVDAAAEVRPGHRARLVVARSSTNIKDADADLDEPQPGIWEGDASRYTAAMLNWRSEFQRSGTTVDLTGRMIGAGFHSMGMAFVRSGSRSIDGTVTQDLGRLRLRLGYKSEMRSDAAGSDQVLLNRYRVQSTYKLSRKVTLRASLLPLTVEGREPSIQDQRTMVSQLGMNVRWRRKKTMFALMADCSRYDHVFVDGSEPVRTTWYASSGAEMMSERVRFGLNHTALFEQSVNGSVTHTIAVDVAVRLRNGTEIGTGTVIDPQALDNIGGRVSFKQPLAKHLFLTLSAERWQDRKIFQSEDLGEDMLGTYTCSAMIGYTW